MTDYSIPSRIAQNEGAELPDTIPPKTMAEHSLNGDNGPDADTKRPAMMKQWQTERPQASTKDSAPNNPRMARHATNTSALNEAIWNSHGVNDDTSTSFSSSSDEGGDLEEANAGERRTHRGRRGSQEQKNGRGAFSIFNFGNKDYNTRGRVSRKDGRLDISVNETSNKGYLAKALGATFQKLGPAQPTSSTPVKPDTTRSSSEVTFNLEVPRPRMNIVVMVIGSRGDIQPFLKLGKNLKEYGHRVRIATHPAFKDFVQNDSGLEFFSVGGDPAELMAFMVKNPGMIPTMETLKQGEVGRRRDQMAEMFEGFWRACINSSDDEKNAKNLDMMAGHAPFIADAIIANPPSFAHIHCAERLGVPLHLMFTFPYTPTQAFPHPLANIKKTNVDPGYTNFMSYPLVEMMTWQGLGDLVNNFRVNTLGLEAVSTLWAPGQLYRMKVPYTYLWSPGLVPKPKDWGPEIDIAGFVFLDLASSFEPPEELTKFLEAGDQPIYIGFGSIVVDNPDKFTSLIFEAVKKAGVRALVSEGWGKLGGNVTPDDVYMLENTPHDWLFPRVKAVVHHGGAGTTAIGLKCGKPTMVVPFFGDQPFWGTVIGNAGAGAKPVPYKDLTADKLADGIKQLLTEEAAIEATKISDSIEAEGDGAKNAVTSFHRSLALRGEHSMRCSILEDRVAVWRLKNTSLRLCALAAELLIKKKKITWKQLRLVRHHEWNDYEGPGEPVSGGTTAVIGSVTKIATGIGSIPFRIRKSVKRRAMHEEKKRKYSINHHKNSLDGSHDTDNLQGVDASRKSTDANAHGTHVTDKKNCKKNVDMCENVESGCAHNASQDKKREDENDQHQVTEKETPQEPISLQQQLSIIEQTGRKDTTGEPVVQKNTAQNEQQNPEDNDDNDDEDELSDDPDTNPAEEFAHDIGIGLGKSTEAIARMPMDLSLAIAQGFHNAPRLYGDTTVRRPTRITGIKSGFKAAGEEFVYGVYDGFSGVVVQPYKGARDGGAAGFVKGVGMGLTGFVLKDLSAIVSPFAYSMKGVHKELLKSKQPTAFIRKARVMEGERDLAGLSEKEKQEAAAIVSHGWEVVYQIRMAIADKRSQGLKSKLFIMRTNKTLQANGAFENVKQAERALEATKGGERLDGVFEEQRKELRDAKKPRRKVEKGLVEERRRRETNGEVRHGVV